MSDIVVKFEVPDGEPPHPDEPFQTEEVACRVAERFDAKGEGFSATVWKDGAQVRLPEHFGV